MWNKTLTFFISHQVTWKECEIAEVWGSNCILYMIAWSCLLGITGAEIQYWFVSSCQLSLNLKLYVLRGTYYKNAEQKLIFMLLFTGFFRKHQCWQCGILQAWTCHQSKVSTICPFRLEPEWQDWDADRSLWMCV